MLIYLLFSCKEEPPPKPQNIAPEITILYPDEEGWGQFEEGEVVEFLARAVDSDEKNVSNLMIQWLLDENRAPICPFTAADENGESACALTLLPEMEEIIVQVKDANDAIGSAQQELNIAANVAPQIEISSLSTDALYAGDIPFRIEAIVSDENDPIVEVMVSWESDLLGDLDISSAPNNSGVYSAELALPEGVHVLKAIATDQLGAQGADSIQITVGASGIPVIDSIGITDEQGGYILEAFDGQTIACIVATTNPYDLPLRYAIRWFNQAGEELTVNPDSTQLSLNFATQNLSDGESLTCQATVSTAHTEREESTTISLNSCNPFSLELPYDGVDSNCDGLEYLNDQNQDGVPDDADQDFHDRDVNTARLGVECYGKLHVSSESEVYYLICDNEHYWKEAQNFCVENGYDSLATLHLDSEFQALATQLSDSVDYAMPDGSSRSGEVWLGFTRGPDCFPTANETVMGFPSICSADPSDYYWIDGGSRYYINATHWWAGEGTPAGEHCVEMKLEAGEAGFWDLYCDTTEMPPHNTWAGDHVRPAVCMKPLGRANNSK